MKRFLILLFCCFSALFTFANDGVFYASGNQLIPITETDISVKKEVLTINRVGDHLEVTVYYEFFNPVGEKELLVGFEAESPYNGPDPMDFFPKHPHIRNFKVVVNGQSLSFEIAHVERGRYDDNGNYVPSKYYSNGQFQDWTKKQIEDTLIAWNYPGGMPIDYVYHFKAKFRPGLNIIQHTYEYDLSFSVGEEYDFPYVLTAANRWANRQIDDFTLNINMGDRESFRIKQTFFEKSTDWTINGIGMAMNCEWTGWDTVTSGVIFHIQQGGISFHKQNFHPDGELFLVKDHLIVSMWRDWNSEQKTSDEENLINGIKNQYNSLDTAFISGFFEESPQFTSEQRRILKNLPFAYRGYKFKDRSLRKYFESTEWYLPNPEYDGNMDVFSAEERKWVEFWK
ncbi:MAG: YARHG domain-containing protein [Bacteroidales bacterium]|nr:YARHG domain-containing protein [Bacteroidales bacterium]